MSRHHPIRILLSAVVVALVTVAGAAVPASPAAGQADSVVEAVNAGGDLYTTASGVVFDADAATMAFSGGRRHDIQGTVGNTSDPALYETVRAGRSIQFTASGLAAGSYDVTFYFVEPVATSPGSRTFDVTVEGIVVLDNYDIFSAAGGVLVADTETITTDVLDGELDVGFTSVSGSPIVAAIEVDQPAAPSPEGMVTVSPSSVDFGSVAVGTETRRTVTVSNATSNPVTLLGSRLDTMSFSLSSPVLPATLAPADSVDLSVVFVPPGVGGYTANLTVATDDPGTPRLVIPLSGSGSAVQDGVPDVAVDPTALDFGTTNLAAPVTQDLTLTNTGTADLTVTSIAADSDAFVVESAFPATIPPGSHETFATTFEANLFGNVSGTLSVASDDPDEPEVSVPVSGTVEPYPASSVAVLGCSNTAQHVLGYLDASSLDQLAPAFDLGGGTLQLWSDIDPQYWDVYEQLRPPGGYAAAWVQLCIREVELGNDNHAQIGLVVDEIRARDGDIPIIVSPINSYAEGTLCVRTGLDGPAVAAEVADWAAANVGAVRGPNTGPLSSDQLRPDDCHLNAAGISLVGDQLVSFFDGS